MKTQQSQLIQWNNWTAQLVIGCYAADNRIKSIQLIDPDDGMPIATATVYVEGLQPGEIGIKNWSENEGLYEALVKQGIVTKAHRMQPSGYVEIHVCHLIE